MATAVQPWGMSRLALYPNTVELLFSRTELDAATQTTRYFDSFGQPVELGGHGTSNSTSTSTATGADGGGAQPPAPADSDSYSDTSSD